MMFKNIGTKQTIIRPMPTLMVLLLILLGSPFLASAQTNAALPVAITVPVVGAAATGGQVVVFDQTSGVYRLAQSVDADGVYGITVLEPPLLFVTENTTTPVITSGSVYVRFSSAAGAIDRGDLLITSAELGVVQKATVDDEHVFAIALEDSRSSNNGQILVQFDPLTARAMHEKNQEAYELGQISQAGAGGTGEAAAEEPGIFERLFEAYARGVIATIIAVGSLFFVMYTFRSTIINATLAVGRNPRARNAIMTVSIGNIIFTLVISLLAIFIALAILVLPV